MSPDSHGSPMSALRTPLLTPNSPLAPTLRALRSRGHHRRHRRLHAQAAGVLPVVHGWEGPGVKGAACVLVIKCLCDKYLFSAGLHGRVVLQEQGLRRSRRWLVLLEGDGQG